MFKAIFAYEIKYNFRKPTTFIFFGLFLGIGFLMSQVLGGAFQNATANLGKTYMNSSIVISSIFSAIIYWTLLLFPGIIGDSIYRDFRTESYPLFFTKPITVGGYLGGRFLGSVMALAIMLSGFEFGFFIGTFMPWMNQDLVGPTHVLYYINDFVLFILPNVLLMGSIVFCAATLSRNILFTYIVCIAFYVVRSVSGSLLSNVNNQTLSSLLDPFGSEAIDIFTRYWSVAEKNTRMVPMEGIILYNRLIWLGVSTAFFSLTYFRFDLKYSEGIRWFRRKIAKQEDVPFTTGRSVQSLASISRKGNVALKQWLYEVGFEYKAIAKSIPFIIFMLIGTALLILLSTQMDSMYQTSIYPLTSRIIPLTQGGFNLILIIFFIYFSGEIVWKERALKINQVYDSMPFASWLPMISKLSAFVLVQITILAWAAICGIIIQASKGFYHFELGLYFENLILMEGSYFLLFSVLAFTIQVIANNKYVGYTAVIAVYLFLSFAGLMGLNQPIYLYGADTGVVYSDMNKFGHFLFPYIIHRLYWGAMAGMLVVLSIIFWQRGVDTYFRLRMKSAAARLTKPLAFTLAFCLIVFVAFGSFIFYNTHILHSYKTSFENDEETAQYERKYKKYEKMIQPRITDVVLNADLFPMERAATLKGYYWLKNKSSADIKELHMNMDPNEKISYLKFSCAIKETLNDSIMGYHIYTFDNPMKPGDSIKMDFTLNIASKGFRYGGTGGAHIIYNGTFINNQSALPSFGYNPGAELSDDNTRKKHGLQPKELMPPSTDPYAAAFNMISQDADWINFEATVSTSADQIAIAPGYLQKEWKVGDRKYYHYKMDNKIINFYSILSARYTVLEDSWTSPEGKKVNIQIFYQHGQTYDLDMMVKGIKKTLDYCGKNFSPYQYHQVRILEFPRYASFAQSFPNTIPFSESIGFITKVDPNNPDDIAYPFYVTCHEVAHQWWGHQVIGANAKGAALMCESMAQYCALMVMEKEYGKAMMEKFLRYEMDGYLRARGVESKGEPSLEDVEGQGYVYYQKGGIAMYALREYIGEDSLNNALKRYVKAVAFSGPPYTNSREFLKFIRSGTPDSMQYLVKDMFEKITFYENSVKSASYTKLANGKYKVDMEIAIGKKYSDKLGNEKPAAVNDYFEVGVYGESKDKNKPNFIYLQKMKLTDKTKKIELIVGEKPIKAGIDPRHLLIDRNITDNTVNVGDASNAVAKK